LATEVRTLDPLRLEVVKHAFAAIGDEMAVVLQRTAYSTNIKTRLDFSCAFFDQDLHLITQAFGQPTHLGSLPHSVPRAIAEYGLENLGPDDALLLNDPHRGATHLNDIALISPIHADGELLGVVANIAHHVDVGGSSPGSLGVTTEVFQEGLIIPPVKLVEGGRINADLLRFIEANVRLPEASAGDFRAQLAANAVAGTRIRALADRLGREAFRTYCDALNDYSERRTRAALAAIPPGVYQAEDFLDNDGVTDEPVRVAVCLRIDAEGVTVDLTGTAEQRRAPVNATYSMTYAGVAYALRTQIDDDIPINDGFYRCFRVIAPEGTIVNPRRPAPVGAGWEVCFRVTEACFRALAQAVPQRVVAGTKGCICNVAFGGQAPGDGHYYAYYETIAGGGGARPTKDGMDAIQTHIHNTENASVEEIELGYPVRIPQLSLVPDSEGAGRFRGGLGVRRDFWFPEAAPHFSILSDRARFAPHGLEGGLPGHLARYMLDPGADEQELNSKVSLDLEPGHTVSIRTPGGGGYGNPCERDPQAVLQDIRLGKLTPERARTTYGVALTPDGRFIDQETTEQLRAQMVSRPEVSQ
jgi:N-methylhydantoinase B